MIELEDRILERALAGERERIPATEVRSRYEVPEEVLDRLAELEVLTPGRPRLLALGRADRGGDQPLPRGRLRRADRVHGLRHAALQAGARAARGRGGRGAHQAPRRATSTPTGRWR